MCTTPATGLIEPLLADQPAQGSNPPCHRQGHQPRSGALLGTPTTRRMQFPRRPLGVLAPRGSRLRYVSATRIIQGLMATGGWDPAFIIARRRYLMRHPEG